MGERDSKRASGGHFATPLVGVVPALVRYESPQLFPVAHKRGNHRGKPGGGICDVGN